MITSLAIDKDGQVDMRPKVAEVIACAKALDLTLEDFLEGVKIIWPEINVEFTVIE